MKSIYEQFEEGTLKEGQRLSVTGTIRTIDTRDNTLMVEIDGGERFWMGEPTFKYMEPAPEKLYEVSIGGHLLSYYGCDYTGGVWDSFLWRRREVDSDILVQSFPMSFLEKHFPEAVAIAQEITKEEV
ncbi:hypothetical protein POQMFEI_00046 [Enterococcus phage vB_OCPT_CCS2]|nr:hypothetical protein POQMFEI_00046 [Enterococcus phage vB_OCPT_CCS2]WDS60700.1 hypothetical protein [Enterococcus phage vB_EfKS5]